MLLSSSLLLVSTLFYCRCFNTLLTFLLQFFWLSLSFKSCIPSFVLHYFPLIRCSTLLHFIIYFKSYLNWCWELALIFIMHKHVFLCIFSGYSYCLNISFYKNHNFRFFTSFIFCSILVFFFDFFSSLLISLLFPFSLCP